MMDVTASGQRINH